MEEQQRDTLAEETIELFREYSEKRDKWATHAQEDKEFRLGRQWTQEQIDTLKARGQAPIVVNRIHPAVETAKAFLTSNRPSFKIFSREDSDVKTATAFTGLLTYIWDHSDGCQVLRQCIDDYYVTGMGTLHAYIDSMDDMGKGEVKFGAEDPLDVYIDPNSRQPFCDDADNILISRLITKQQAAQLLPMYEELIAQSIGDLYSDRPVTSRGDDGELIFPEDLETKSDDNEKYVRWYERYSKRIVKRYRVYEQFSGREDLMEAEEFKGYIQRPAWIVNGQVITDYERAMKTIQMLMQQYEQQMMQYNESVMQYQQSVGEDEAAREAGFGGMNTGAQTPQRPEKPQIQETTFMKLAEAGMIDIVIIPVWRVVKTCVVGDKTLYTRVLPVEHYPIIIMKNLDTRTCYPTSDVRMVKNLQEYINKIRSLIIAHATTSTNVKILLPRGSVDIVQFEQEWAKPSVAIEVDTEFGVPIPVQPLPLPNELYQNELTAKNDIDHQLGLYEFMMGNPQGAPDTNSGMLNLDDFGKRKIRSKLDDIESALIRLGKVLIPLMQELYTTEKIVRILEPNNIQSEYAINKGMYDTYGNVIETLNDIAVGKYDITVQSGSTLPTNRNAQLQLYMEVYKLGIIDRQEVLKKTEIFDAEGVLKRIDITEQLQQQLRQSQEQIKKLQGDLQTREREVYHAKQETEVEKFKSSLDKTGNKAQAARQIYEDHLKQADKEIQKRVAEDKDTRNKKARGETQ